MAVPQEALDMHVKMTTDLDNHIGRSINKDQYEQLKNRLRSELTPKDLVSGANSIMDILNCLERKGKVKPGKYDILKKIVSEFDVRIVDNVIEPAEKAIKDIISRHEKSLVSSSSEFDTGEATGCTNETGMAVDLSTSTSKSSTQPPEKKRKLEKASSDEAKHVYEHSPDQKGLMLILNFSKARQGSEGDVEKLRELFEETFRFEVEPQSDLTKEVLLRELKDYRKAYMETSRVSKKYYCFICVIMSHGDQNGIRTDDDQSVTMDEITDIFKNKETPGFVGKPKIFVVQACRGSGVQPVVEPDEYTPDIDDFVGKMSVPHDADILIAYATTPGHKAFRTKFSEIGAWFIHVLLEVIKESHDEEHLEEMLITVRHQIALDPEWRRSEYCQMPCCWTTLTKRLYFRKTKKA